MTEPKEPTPADLLIADWRSRICPICEWPLDLQIRDPWAWWCALCRRWFDEHAISAWTAEHDKP